MSASLVLNEEELARLFSFYFTVDEELRVVNFGPSLRRLNPSVEREIPAPTQLLVERRVASFDTNSLASLTGQFVVIHLWATGRKHCGQLIRSKGTLGVIFLGAPWIISVKGFDEFGLKWGDYAVYDSVADFVHLLEAKESTRRDLKSHNRILAKQRDELRQGHRILQSRYAVDDALEPVEDAYGAVRVITRAFAEGVAWDRGAIVEPSSTSPHYQQSYAWCQDVVGDGDIDESTALNVELIEVVLEVSRAHFAGPDMNSVVGASLSVAQNSYGVLILGFLPSRANELAIDNILGQAAKRLGDTMMRPDSSSVDRSGQVGGATERATAFPSTVDRLVTLDAVGRVYHVGRSVVGLREGSASTASELESDTRIRLEVMLAPYIPRLKGAGPTAWPVHARVPCRGQNEEIIDLEITLIRSCGSEMESYISMFSDCLGVRRMSRPPGEPGSLRRNDVLTVISHEGSTPLHGSLGMNQLVSIAQTSDERSEWLCRAERNAQTLCRMVDGMFELSPPEAQPVRLAEDAVDLIVLVEQTLAQWRGLARQKTLELVFRVATVVPRTVLVDEARLANIVGSLVDNAIKFTIEGYVEISLAVNVHRNDPIASVCIGVVDSGCGLAPQHHEQVFERFFRVNSTTTRGQNGAGLGLSVARAQVQLMGGTIGLQSTLGGGSRFSIEIATPILDTRPAVEVDGAIATRPIVLVEPHERQRLAMAHSLRAMGFCVDEHNEFNEGVVAGDGPIVLRSIPQGEPESPKTGGDESSASRVMAYRADLGPNMREGAAVAKPVGPHALIRLITEAIHQEDRSTTDTIDKRRLSILLAEDNEDNRILVRVAMDRVGHHLDEAIDGEEAVRMASENHYDIILLDIEMPKLGGLEVATRLREREQQQGLPPTPMVAVTAHTLSDFIRQTRDAGIDTCVTKPISTTDLLAVIQQYGTKQFMTIDPERSTTQPPPVAQSAYEPLPPDREALDPDAEDLLPLFLKSRLGDLARLGDLMEANELPKIMHIGHNLKGTGSSYGYPQLSEVGASLEAAARDENRIEVDAQIRRLMALTARIEQWAQSVGIQLYATDD